MSDEELDRPLPQSRSGMTWRRWFTLLDRYVAGEPKADLAAEYAVDEQSIHFQAKKWNMRKKDRPGAVRLAKGPPMAEARLLDDGTVRLTCRSVAFVLDPDDADATNRAVLEAAARAAAAGETREAMSTLAVGRAARDLIDPGWRTRARLQCLREDAEAQAEAVAAIDAEPVRAPVVLRPAQTPPPIAVGQTPWRTWLFMGGRGAGKTLAGASWLSDRAMRGRRGRLALIGATLHDVREVMVEGVSGIRALARWSRADRPRYEPSRRRLLFDNGAVAHCFSAEDPDSLRGPQFAAAWADEFCAWPRAGARGAGETLALLRMGLRLGETPQLVVTTTPRATRPLKALRDEASCVVTHAATAENTEHLAPGFLEELEAIYGGTRQAAQELEGRVVEMAGALFTAEMMAGARMTSVPAPEGEGRRAAPGGGGKAKPGRSESGLPCPPHPVSASLRPPSPEGEGDSWGAPLDRIVVAIDPTTTAGGDACGIVAAGSRRRADGRREAVVLADRSAAGLSPDGWARRATALAAEVGAGLIVAEVNQGGEMVKAVLRTAGCALRVREVRATRGKRIRAEPVAALYEQGRVRHAGVFAALEEELMAFGGEGEADGSLDRADALVWAITDLLIDRPEGETGPRVRGT